MVLKYGYIHLFRERDLHSMGWKVATIFPRKLWAFSFTIQWVKARFTHYPSKTLYSFAYVLSDQVINVYMEKKHSSLPSVLSFPNVKMSVEQRPGITPSCQSPSKTLGCVSWKLVRRQMVPAASQSPDL